MRRFIVYNPASGLYLPHSARNGGTLDGARLFTTKGAAKQSAKAWTSDNVALQEVSLAPILPPPPATWTPSFSGIIVLPFKMVVEYFRDVYLADIVHYSPASKNSAPLLPYLEAHNRFLKSMGNGDQILIKLSDFDAAHPSLRIFAKELVEVFGVEDESGVRFCLFKIDWKDEDGNIKADY